MPRSTGLCDPDPQRTVKGPSSKDEMAGIDQICMWDLRNLNDYVRCPNDFLKPMTRSDTEPSRNIYAPVKQIDVTTSWKDLSTTNAEELFRIHTIFHDALKSILADDVQSMFTTIKQNFHQHKGNFAYLDGFRVAIENRWVMVDREQLIHVMTEQAYDYFSQKQYQPNRSALMQLYLSSTECFLDWARYERQSISRCTGMALRTFYDQLSRFEAPVATAGSFCDYVQFLNLNPTPYEDQELVLIPQYNREGIFVQTPYPEDVKYTMESPISWLAWDVDIQGFRGRVPTYSAFSKSRKVPGRYPDSDYTISHILELTIHAVFTKYCTMGQVHFQRLVRTRLIFGVLPKIPSSATNSVYGVEQSQRSISAPYGFWVAHESLAASGKNSHAQNSPSREESSISHIRTCSSEAQDRYTPHALSLPKRASGPPMPQLTCTQSVDGSNSSILPRKLGFTAFPAQCYVPSAAVVPGSPKSSQDSTTLSGHEAPSDHGRFYDSISYKGRPLRLVRRSNQQQTLAFERKLAKKKTNERKQLQGASGLFAFSSSSVQSSVVSETQRDPSSEAQRDCPWPVRLSMKAKSDSLEVACSPKKDDGSPQPTSSAVPITSSEKPEDAPQPIDTKVLDRKPVRLSGSSSESEFFYNSSESDFEKHIGSSDSPPAQESLFDGAKIKIPAVEPEGHTGHERNAGIDSSELAQVPSARNLPDSLPPNNLLQKLAAITENGNKHHPSMLPSEPLTNVEMPFRDSSTVFQLNSNSNDDKAIKRSRGAPFGMGAGGTLSFNDVIANRNALPGMVLGSRFLSLKAPDIPQEQPQSQDRHTEAGTSVDLTSPLTFKQRTRATSEMETQRPQHDGQGRDMAVVPASKTLSMRQQAQCSMQPRDDGIESRSTLCTSRFSSDSSATESFNTLMNSLNIEEHGSVSMDLACVTPQHSPEIFAIDSDPKREIGLQVGILRSWEDKKLNCPKQGQGTDRLGLEEELALQAAIIKSREEGFQRQMALRDFETSYDDIFDTSSANQSFDSESGMDEPEMESAGTMGRDIDGTLKPGVPEAKARFLKTWIKLTELWKERSRRDEFWRPIELLIRDFDEATFNRNWAKRKELEFCKRYSLQSSSRPLKETSDKSVDADEEL